MKLLILSDSHGRHDKLSMAVERCPDADAILHLGDGYADLRYVKLPDAPVYTVKGNGEDWFMNRDDVPITRLLSFEGVNILMMHGHTHSVKSDTSRAARCAYESGADLLLFGHTHVPLEKYLPEGTELYGVKIEKPIRLFNPGSVGEARFGGGSFGVITLKNGEILMSHGELED